jgi:NitT/TauT family transport system substrate-binding protein
MRRRLVLGGVLAAPLLGRTARAADDVPFALNWIISGRNAGYFTALEKGFYREVGINARITRGRGSGDTLKRVAIGESQFGLVDTATLLSGRANDDLPVKMVGMMYDKAATALLYTRESGIRAPKDMEGRAVARSAAGSTINMWPAFLATNGIERSKIREITVPASSYVAMLLSRQVDAVLDQSSYHGRYQKAAAPQGLTIDMFRFSDFGYQLYGDAIVAAEPTLSGKADLVRRFLAATLRGNLHAFENPDEAIAILARSATEVEADVAKAELLDMRGLAMTEEVAEHGYGFIDGAKLEGQIRKIEGPLGFKRRLGAAECFTLDFLPRRG